MWTIKRKGYTLEITQAEMADPRKYNDMLLGKMICFHRRYKLGDDHDFDEPYQLQQYFENNKHDIYCVLPLYLYDHSGITMSTSPFNDPWDSGQVGYMYCTKKDVEESGLNPETDYAEVEEMLKEEVKEYDKWLTGDPPYFEYIITDENDNIVENRSFFALNDFKEMLDEMKNQTDEKFGFLFDRLLKQQEMTM